MSPNMCKNNPTASSDHTTANALRLNVSAPKIANDADIDAAVTKISE